ncbi:MAG TPA: hypothetical protein VLE50_07730 [Cellvibrio sp.]|nr:hypothetical protein [Cellvibrio sp.]
MRYSLIIALVVFALPAWSAEDRIELETTRIKGNQELPQILYVVPWKDMESTKDAEQKLVLHDFFGELYDPVVPAQMQQETESKK